MAYFCSTAEEELVRVNAISDGAPYERYPVENDWRFCRILEQKLFEYVQDNSKHNE